jgi:hypothetical protein
VSRVQRVRNDKIQRTEVKGLTPDLLHIDNLYGMDICRGQWEVHGRGRVKEERRLDQRKERRMSRKSWTLAN